MKTLKNDLTAGFLVFLIALPLSIGISVASGFPPLSGLMTAVLGGLIAGTLTGAPMTVKGPAAGLIVIVLGSIEALGGPSNHGIEKTLAAIAVAGIIQVIFAQIKAGKMAEYFPTSAVHGMLAAIGVIIVSKQIHIALGVTPSAKTPLALLAEIPHSISQANPYIAIIGITSIVMMFLAPQLPKTKSLKFLGKVPAAVLVLSVAIPLGLAFEIASTHTYLFWGKQYVVGPNFLVTIPANLQEAFISPDFSSILSLESIKYIVMFALVGSLESLLTVKAIDSLNTNNTASNGNRDLMAVGIGNILAGLLGGLPMISEVVRSSANVAGGAKTKFANVFHGVLILMFVVLAPQVLHLIPSSALAAVLLFTGYRLASPHHWKESWNIGQEQFVVFSITVFTTLATDLLLGIFTGIIVEVLINRRRGAKLRSALKAEIKLNDEQSHSKDMTHIQVSGAVTFANVTSVADQLNSLTASHVRIDVNQVNYADHTAVKTIESLYKQLSSKGKTIEWDGLETLEPTTSHPYSAVRSNKIPRNNRFNAANILQSNHPQHVKYGVNS